MTNFERCIRLRKQGDPLGFHNICILYERGEEIEQNYSKAIEYYEKTAQLGFSMSFSYLGILYEEWNGVEQNYAKSIEYYEKASLQCHECWIYQLEEYFNGDFV